jgi:Uma2 family endonuclease
MSVMTASRTELPDDRPLTVEDLDLLPDDGRKYELDDGVLVVSPAPVLAIEIASPSTAIYDRNRKKDVYAGFGIASYWIVAPSQDKPRLTAFELRRGAYREVADISGNESLKARKPFEVQIVPAALVAGPWSR